MNQSSKFTILEDITELGLPVPPLVLIDYQLITDETALATTIKQFTQQYPHAAYIVRSAVSVEDDPQRSWAGHFESSGPTEASQLLETTQLIFHTNLKKAQALNTEAAVAVFIMPYIVAECGGVAFTPWHYFYRHSLVAHAHTPAEATRGKNTQNELLDHTCQTHQEGWKNRLSTCLNALQHRFAYPIDIEWVDDGAQTWILQVRPVTIMPLATSVFETIPTPTGYTHTLLSEAFGKLSPISFSLYTHLYENNTWLTHLLDITGGASFFHRLPTGQVLVNEAGQKRFFSNRHWYSAFLRAWRSSIHKSHTIIRTDQSDLDAAKYAFADWQAAAAIARTSASTTLPQEYELTTTIDTTRYSRPGEVETCKRRFMETLKPFREQVAQQPALAWGEVTPEGTTILSDTWKEQYATELAYSTQWHSPTVSPTISWSHRATLPSSLPKLYIEHPETWATQLPRNTIIITPRIPHTWIPELPYLAGIITTELAPLSHAAIVLREHNIPTQVMNSLPTQ